jgi:hypothetical protein
MDSSEAVLWLRLGCLILPMFAYISGDTHGRKSWEFINKRYKDALEIDCFEAGANRAAVIMAWVLTFDHFLNYVFANKLAEFNKALAASPDKKVKAVAAIEDFEDLREASHNTLQASTVCVVKERARGSVSNLSPLLPGVPPFRIAIRKFGQSRG